MIVAKAREVAPFKKGMRWSKAVPERPQRRWPGILKYVRRGDVNTRGRKEAR